MKQLSGLDNVFLLEESRGHQMGHVACLAIYDPSTAPGGFVRFKQILEHFEERMHVSKVFRRRLVRTPLQLNRPYWIDEPSVDIEYHVRHIALPKPGDWRQLMIQVARIHSRPMDLSKPAWEAYVIEGLDNIPGMPEGSFALYSKAHHAAVDGEAFAALFAAFHSLSPEIDNASKSPRTIIADSEPTTLELLIRSLDSGLLRFGNALQLVSELAPMSIELVRTKVLAKYSSIVSAQEEPEEDLHASGYLETPLPTRFNKPLSAHRVIEALPFPLEQVQLIRHCFPGVTINDVFMAVCGGAMRRYLQAKGELPADSMNAMIPMSTRSSGAARDADAGNQAGMVPLPVFSNIDAPLERLRLVHQATTRGKNKTQSVGKGMVGRLMDVLPGPLMSVALHTLVVPQANFTISNVRGPARPLYMAGAKLHMSIPINMLLDGIGLSITGFSYGGVLWVGFVADRVMLPDPQFFKQCLQESLDEYVELAKTAATEQLDQQAKPRPEEKPKASAKSKSVAKPKVEAQSAPDASQAGTAKD